MFVSVNTPGLGAVAPLGYGYARPRYRGLGQAAGCPSLEQLMGITDPTDPCQQASTSVAGVASTCYNTSTGSPVSCPVAGNVQTTPPAAVGPLGLPSSLTADMPWILAGIAAILVVGFIAKG